jgi:hypothetical protein
VRVIVRLLGTMALLLASPAVSQDASLEPSFGYVSLGPEFQPDPRTALAMAGGSVNLVDTVAGCLGFIPQKPALRLIYSGNPNPSTFPLFIHAYSESDTTILVKAPDGKWYCNDDGFNSPNPMLIFGPPMSGEYSIWLGTFEAGEKYPAIVGFSEVGADVSGFAAELSREVGR